MNSNNFMKNIFKKYKSITNVDSGFYKLSIRMDRENQRHLDDMNLHIKMLNERNIKWTTFISEITLATSINPFRHEPFNICVDIEDKDKLLEIHIHK